MTPYRMRNRRVEITFGRRNRRRESRIRGNPFWFLLFWHENSHFKVKVNIHPFYEFFLAVCGSVEWERCRKYEMQFMPRNNEHLIK